MHKCIVITASVVAATTGLSIWALIKLYKSLQELKNLKESYSDPKVVQKYLMHHYGSLNMVPLLKDLIAKECEHFHQRIAGLCKLMCLNYDTPMKRVLDVGSATGALTFYLSEAFEEVIGTDTSYFMINTCELLKEYSETVGLFSNEGGCHSTPFVAKLPSISHEERVSFWDEDVCNLVFSCGHFNCVVVANTMKDLAEPKRFLNNISDYVLQGGLLIIADTYNWKNGPESDLNIDGALRTFEYLKSILSSKWLFVEDKNLPYYMANSDRSAEIGNCHFTVWKRKSDLESLSS